jgi:hypothetical protein
MSDDTESLLLRLIDAYLAGQMGILMFEERFDSIHYDEARAAALSESAKEFFEDVQELLTFANPAGSFDEVDRAAGVLTYEEYAGWLRGRLDGYLQSRA